MDIATSRRNIEEGLVEITSHGQHFSNGILVTSNGYFLTANHCVCDLSWKNVRLNNGRTYAIEKVCATNTEEDLALAKAKIPGKPEIQRYRFYNTNLLKKIPVALVTRINGKLVEKYGFVNLAWNPHRTNLGNGSSVSYYNHFTSYLFASPGDSGGVIISQDGRLVGIHSGSDRVYNAVAAKLIQALELVSSYQRILTR